MGIFVNPFQGIGDIFGPLWFVITHGGWLALVGLAVYILFKLYYFEIVGQFVASQQWVFLSIKVPRENLTSTLAVEQIFTQMHALFSSLTFTNKYMEGKIMLWYSLQIVSLGGKVSFIIRVPKDNKELVEAAIYSQYPNAELDEVDDYLENINYDPQTSDFDLWGTEFSLVKDQVFPIKTYREFEHPTAEQKIIDPLAPLIESLTKMQPWEFYGVQIIIQPAGDGTWEEASKKKAKELTGEKLPKTITFKDKLLSPFDAVADFSFGSLLTTTVKPEAPKDQKNNLQNMTEVEKDTVNAIQSKIAKPGYFTKIRHLYIAPKDKFDPTKKALTIGAMRTLGSGNSNGFKPDTKKTWTDPKYKISPTLEKPYLERLKAERKKYLFQGFKERNIFFGNAMPVLNVEEIATIYHLPLTLNPSQPPVAVVESKKAQPPVNLPVGDFEV
jgi:hypothetical protein